MTSSQSSLELIATATFGLEAVVARELKDLGYEDQQVEDGRVTFKGDALAICRTNLHLRSADRVLVKIGSFEARDFGQLFDRVKALPWSDWLTAEAKFPVTGRSVKSILHSVPDCQAITKKAIVEQMKKATRINWFPEDGPEFPVEVSLLKDRATLTLDTSGDGLHKRGYRKLVGPAPLKETLAAGLLQLTYWNRDRPFLDPFCGTGTIAIEAAMMGRGMAPGWKRTFAAEHWPIAPKKLWDAARDEGRQMLRPKLREPLIASDIDPASLQLARQNAEFAGVAGDIVFEQRDMRKTPTDRQYGCLVTNPPYGERLGQQQDVARLMDAFGLVMQKLETWSIYVLTAFPDFEQHVHRKADRRRKLYNGRIECGYYQYQGPKPPRTEPTPSKTPNAG